MFGDDVMAAVSIGRLMHQCHIVNIRGNSYRMKNHIDLGAALRSGLGPAPSSGIRTETEQKPRHSTRRREAHAP